MFVLRLSAGGVSFRRRSCVAGHGPGIRVVTTFIQRKKVHAQHAQLQLLQEEQNTALDNMEN